ncbi:hypothetical protein PACTADRAFT_25618, partial [Pachysolen tannophilus NRRL Y-2460]
AKKTLSGYVQKESFDNATFQIQKRTFDMLGYTEDPTIASDDDGVKIVGDLSTATKFNNQDITMLTNSKKDSKILKKRRKNKGTLGIVGGKNSYKGPWAEYNSNSSSGGGSGSSGDSDEGNDSETTPITPDRATLLLPENDQYALRKQDEETTEFFGPGGELDYQGRTYMHIPPTLSKEEPGSKECFVPKKLIHTWDGHHGGTNKLQFFPRSGHLLLSCGNDSKILLYDAFRDSNNKGYPLLRGFFGHSKAVKDINFNYSGDKFLSCSYDRTIKQWDTETGKCISRIKLNSLPNVIKYNPLESLQTEFLVGLTNKKIEQYDLRSNEVIQTYDHHLGAINSITFLEDNRRFLTSSDDKSLKVWNWQINIPIKAIAHPAQHSMPCVKLHPSRKYFAAQSMDNTILTFNAYKHKNYKKNKKKLFIGHNSAGYGIDLNFSYDGKILMSGDNNGYAFFWDWKTCKLIKKLKIDDKLINCIEPNPQEVSRVAISGLSGKIYYYE